jgi:hypothetical protein
LLNNPLSSPKLTVTPTGIGQSPIVGGNLASLGYTGLPTIPTGASSNSTGAAMPTRSDSADMGPPTDPRIPTLLGRANALRQTATNLQPPKLAQLSLGQALVGVLGAVATQDNPHAQFVAQYLPAVAQANQQQHGNSEQAWQNTKQGLLDQANALQSQANGLQQYNEGIYKAQMGLYGTVNRGLGAADVTAQARQNIATQNNQRQLQSVMQRGITSQEDAWIRQLGNGQLTTSGQQAAWQALQGMPNSPYAGMDPKVVAAAAASVPGRQILDQAQANRYGPKVPTDPAFQANSSVCRQLFGFSPQDKTEADLAMSVARVYPTIAPEERADIMSNLYRAIYSHRAQTPNKK